MFRYNEQIVVNKDSALMACFEYTGPDTDSQSAAQLLSLMHQAEHAFQVASRNPLTFWFITHRRRSDPYAPAVMPDPTLRSSKTSAVMRSRPSRTTRIGIISPSP